MGPSYHLVIVSYRTVFHCSTQSVSALSKVQMSFLEWTVVIVGVSRIPLSKPFSIHVPHPRTVIIKWDNLGNRLINSLSRETELRRRGPKLTWNKFLKRPKCSSLIPASSKLPYWSPRRTPQTHKEKVGCSRKFTTQKHSHSQDTDLNDSNSTRVAWSGISGWFGNYHVTPNTPTQWWKVPQAHIYILASNASEAWSNSIDCKRICSMLLRNKSLTSYKIHSYIKVLKNEWYTLNVN